jgi:hypothetical protein
MRFDGQEANVCTSDVMDSRSLGDDTDRSGADLIFKIILDKILPPKRAVSPERGPADRRRKLPAGLSDGCAAAKGPSKAGAAQSAVLR